MQIMPALVLYQRKRIRGRLEIIGDGVAHFERDLNEGYVWDFLEGLATQFELIGGERGGF